MRLLYPQTARLSGVALDSSFGSFFHQFILRKIVVAIVSDQRSRWRALLYIVIKHPGRRRLNVRWHYFYNQQEHRHERSRKTTGCRYS